MTKTTIALRYDLASKCRALVLRNIVIGSTEKIPIWYEEQQTNASRMISPAGLPNWK